MLSLILGDILHVIGSIVLVVAAIAGFLIWVLNKALPAWIAPAIIVLLGACFLGTAEMKDREIAALEAKITQMESASKDAHIQDQSDAAKASAGLSNEASKTRTKTNEKVHSVDRHHDDLLRRLRIAEAKLAAKSATSASVTADGQAPSTDDGEELPSRIGEEDVAEAKRADTIRLHLEACYEQYDRAKDAVEKFAQREPVEKNE